MKMYFKAFWTLSLMASISFMVACGGKKDENISRLRGNITTNGQSLYSNSSLNGRPVQILLSDINRGYGGYSTVSFTAVVNGEQRNLSAYLNNGNQQPSATSLGGLDIYYSARCADQACDRTALIIWANSRGYPEWKQMATLKIMSQNVIGSGFEVTGVDQSILSPDQVISELLRLYAQ